MVDPFDRLLGASAISLLVFMLRLYRLLCDEIVREPRNQSEILMTDIIIRIKRLR